MMDWRSTFILCLALGVWPALSSASPKASASRRHVVVLVWDGMRPDFVTPEQTPNLWKLRRDGVSFKNHHSVYPTATQVNGVAFATGAIPARSGLIANREYLPAIRPEKPVDTSDEEVIRRGDEITGGKYLALPTVAETVRAAGRTVAIAGSKSIALLQDRTAEWAHARRTKPSGERVTTFAAAPMPAVARDLLHRLLGRYLSDEADGNAERNAFTTRALTDVLWRDGVTDFSLLWLSEPDLSEHEYAPGSPEASAAIKGSDQNLATVIRALEARKVRPQTDIIVVSDHGFSTITRAVNVPKLLREAGFEVPDVFSETPRRGQIMVVGNGGTSLFYVIDRDSTVTAKLVEWLQRSDFAGVIFTRGKTEGTFDLDSIGLGRVQGPDVMVAMRWGEGKNKFGVAGEVMVDAARGVGNGTHASLSPFDLHNICIAAGPSFRRRLELDTPSGNIDLAPTVYHLLGLTPPADLDGRVLMEALAGTTAPPPGAQKEIRKSLREFSDGVRWRQELETWTVGRTIYLSSGRGGN